MFTCYGGWAGIRTPGAFRHTRFPGVHNRPLCHPSFCRLPLPLNLSLSIKNQNRLRGSGRFLKLQPAEQFVELELQADIKFTEVAIDRAHFVETHLVNDRLDLKSVAREQRHSPFSIIEPART